MAQTEITVQVFEDIENVKTKLQNLGYVWQDTFSGTDTYFSTIPQNQIANANYKQLLDTSIIIRDFHKQKNNFHSVSLVHKRKNLSPEGNVIGEQKTTLGITNPETADQLLSNAGLVRWLVLKQQNSFFSLGEKTIIVGTVEGLDGCFVEIEQFDSIANLTEQQKFDSLRDFVKTFGFCMGNDYSCKKTFMLYQKNMER